MYKHQGDILFIPAKKIAGKKEEHSGSFIVGYGEATGHHHHTVTVIDPEDMEIVRVADGYILKLKSEGVVTHQEHQSITLAPGIYRVSHEREHDWFSLATRKVID